MSGETDLNKLLSGMDPRIQDGAFVFITTRDGALPPNMHPIMMFKEPQGITYILPKEDADDIGLAYDFACRMITLEVHSSLEAVGFLARITTALAKHGIGVNPVSGYFHDHLFVPMGREKEALRVLDDVIKVAATQDYDGNTVL